MRFAGDDNDNSLNPLLAVFSGGQPSASARASKSVQGKFHSSKAFLFTLKVCIRWQKAALDNNACTKPQLCTKVYTSIVIVQDSQLAISCDVAMSELQFKGRTWETRLFRSDAE